jgi:hypothetical protein
MKDRNYEREEGWKGERRGDKKARNDKKNKRTERPKEDEF